MKVIQLHKKDFNASTINLLKKQDRDAQQMVYSKYAPKMLSVCRQYIKDTHFAENIMLDGFLKVFTKIE
ncbi:MAG TPA: RNA polymerase subunit sigma-70, partial [Flavobacteriaceae bacterium]|nr:RNA polymerase subunit sigma-70 [Flavobacteriaceae bacterium]